MASKQVVAKTLQKRFSKVKNPALKEWLTKNPPTRYHLGNLTQLVKNAGLGNIPETEEYVKLVSKKILTSQNQHINYIQEDLNALVVPNWAKKKILANIPQQDTSVVTDENRSDFEVTPFLNQLKQELRPNDWVNQFMSLKSKEDPDYNFYARIFGENDVKQLDKEYEQNNGKVIKNLTDSHEESKKLNEVISIVSSNNSSVLQSFRKELDSLLQKNKQRTEELRRHIQAALDKIRGKDENLEKMFNEQLAGLEEFGRPSNDNGILTLFAKYQTSVLEKYISVKRYEEFKVEPGLISKYKDLDSLRERHRNEVDELQETAYLAFTKVLDKNAEYLADVKTKVEAISKEMEELVDINWNGTASDLFKKYPKWEKKADWLIARHRWDDDDTDEDHKEHLPLDRSFWNLPRNP